MTLSECLAGKPLFYTLFDPERMRNVWQRIRSEIPLPPVIHVVGTNGKGTTGRFLAEYLLRQGLRVGHYTSPHIHRFNERIWLNGHPAGDALLEESHAALQSILTQEESDSLSYFEYTTLLAAVLYANRCDRVVMEAGLGGEYDATAVFDAELFILTPVGLDHQSFLGETIEEVATTKLAAMRCEGVIALQNEPAVYDLATKRSKITGFPVHFVKDHFDSSAFADYLDANRATATLAARTLGFDAQPSHMGETTLFGRFSPLGENVIVDVGHNPLAAQAIGKKLGERKVILVYNTLEDKDYETILWILKPNILRVEIIKIYDERAVDTEQLKSVLERLEIPYADFVHTDTLNDYLVFGSFKTVEAFCKRMNEE